MFEIKPETVLKNIEKLLSGSYTEVKADFAAGGKKK
jgi:hypothetical protein